MKQDTNTNRVVIPMPWTHVINRYWIFTGEQLGYFVISTLISLGILSASVNYENIILKLIIYSAIVTLWLAVLYIAGTHERLQRNKSLFYYYLRRISGYTTVQKYNKKHDARAHNLYPIREVLARGLIKFNENYGYIIKCTPRKNIDEELFFQISNIEKFVNSLHTDIFLRVSARSQVPASNAVQDMTAKKITNKKTQQEKNILYSIHEMSSQAAKPARWDFTVFIGSNLTKKKLRRSVLPSFRV